MKVVAEALGVLAWQRRVDAESRSAAAQMLMDDAAARSGVARARFFLWSAPAVSLGWKQPVPGWLSEPRWRDSGLEWVERPTAGGAALHGSDVSVSVVVPRSANLSLRGAMARVCRSAVRLCASFGVTATALLDTPSLGAVTYCLTETSPYAVMIGRRKTAGFGARRYPSAWLIQGSLWINPLAGSLERALPESFVTGLGLRATALSGHAREPVDARSAAERWAGQWDVSWEQGADDDKDS